MITHRSHYTLALVSFLMLLVMANHAHAVIYTYTDTRGIVHFTNYEKDSRYKPLDRYRRPMTSRTHIDSYIADAARTYNIDPLLIRSIIKTESNFDQNAKSRKGAIGLMQLMPETAKDMHVSDIYDPQDNIFGGARYLRWLANMFNGDLMLVLASYNAGPEKVRKTRSVPNFAETKKYIKTVLSYYKKYRSGHNI